MRLLLLALALGPALAAAQPGTRAAGADDAPRTIQSLSADRIAGLLSGAGLGYARAAELNDYPGPRHVLDLADSLGLTEAQRAVAVQARLAMAAEARARGHELVETEAALDRLFTSGRATPEAVRELTERAGQIEAAIRFAHLNAHLTLTAVLSADQIETYARLRGYRDGPEEDHGDGHDHGHGHRP
jgi:hypothetical protein